MSNTPIKVGMVGAGYILKSHALAVAALDGTSLHAVADSSPQRAADAARQFGFAHSFASVDGIAASDCDVVHVLVPPFLHVEMAETLLRAGKSVFLEKPMGLSSAACRRLGELADSKGLRLGVNHNFLFLPGYEQLRSAIAGGELGRIDHVSCNWNAFLPQIRSGPFDAWMLSAPANLFFELGPHVAAFILDLLGHAAVSAATAVNPVELPSGQQAFRSWSAVGQHRLASFALSISVSPGQSDRLLRVRASGGSAQIDFGRDIHWIERTRDANPIFDAFAVGRDIARQVGRAATRDRRRRLIAALRKSPESSPYGESILRSIARFYDEAEGEVDPRHHWSFGAKVMQFCEEVCAAAGVGMPSPKPISITAGAKTPATAAKVLVVGGTGFIGRRLVAKLVDKGVPVRVLSRSKSAAAIAFAGLPVDIHGGFHGDPEVARKAVEGIECVYHLAKCDGQNWGDYVRGDVEPTRILAEQALAAGVKRFIYTGTIDSCDSASAGKRITGDTPLDPRINTRNLYARSKAACEAVLRELSRDNGLPLILMRPGIVVGAGADPAHIGVANFASENQVQYWGRGDNKLPLVLVDDVADALARASDAPNAIGRTFLLTSDPLLSAQDYVADFGARAGIKVHAKEHATWRYWLADLVKEIAKNIVKHPNRRSSSLHDWRCRSHRSTYDSSATREVLGWDPVNDRDTLAELGIGAAVDAIIGTGPTASADAAPNVRKRRSAGARP
jgi:predicted dehydrogenase/nucleoside-diphosphate-sugar epimerase